MKPQPIYYVDLPVWSPTAAGKWQNVARFRRQHDALRFLRVTWAIKGKVAELFLTVGES